MIMLKTMFVWKESQFNTQFLRSIHTEAQESTTIYDGFGMMNCVVIAYKVWPVSDLQMKMIRLCHEALHAWFSIVIVDKNLKHHMIVRLSKGKPWQAANLIIVWGV